MLSGSKVYADVPKAPTSGLEFPGKDGWETNDTAPGRLQRERAKASLGELTLQTVKCSRWGTALLSWCCRVNLRSEPLPVPRGQFFWLRGVSVAWHSLRVPRSRVLPPGPKPVPGTGPVQNPCCFAPRAGKWEG